MHNSCYTYEWTLFMPAYDGNDRSILSVSDVHYRQSVITVNSVSSPCCDDLNIRRLKQLPTSLVDGPHSALFWDMEDTIVQILISRAVKANKIRSVGQAIVLSVVVIQRDCYRTCFLKIIAAINVLLAARRFFHTDNHVQIEQRLCRLISYSEIVLLTVCTLTGHYRHSDRGKGHPPESLLKVGVQGQSSVEHGEVSGSIACKKIQRRGVVVQPTACGLPTSFLHM
ncbi:hypothetical protein J6590_065480 [Homalodisca vitripennis]|nr:hypothetical protein J6590_065480 [Homalodisca vitripennis]